MTAIEFVLTLFCIYAAYRLGRCHGFKAGLARGIASGIIDSGKVIIKFLEEIHRSSKEQYRKMRHKEDDDEWWKKPGGKPPWNQE